MLIQPRQLYQHITRYRIFDASWYMPASGIDAFDKYVRCRLPQSIHVDIDRQFAADPDTLPEAKRTLPHMLPDPRKFESECTRLGLTPDDQIVFYDQIGLFSSARAWYIFHKVYGHENVFILDGGLPQWLEEGLPTEGKDDPVFQPPQQQQLYSIRADHRVRVVRDLEQIKKYVDEQPEDELVVDARSKERFDGVAEEPRKDVVSGHMPGSINVPFDRLLLLDHNRRFKTKEQIEEVFEEAGLPRSKLHDPNMHITTSCGSGVTAAVLAFALDKIVGFNGKLSLYDGSWSEYGHKDSATKIISSRATTTGTGK